MTVTSAAGTNSSMRDPSKRLVFFHRDFRAFTGGHLKVWDYFNHVVASTTHEARIAFSAESKWDRTNPWFQCQNYVGNWEPDKADVLFLAGTDWRALPEPERLNFRKPVLNLIQHPRHAEAKSELRWFLRNRAVRICVSGEVADAIKATGETNGPVFTISNAIDLNCLPPTKPWNQRSIDLFICGLKAKDLAGDIQAAFADQNWRMKCLAEWAPREDFLTQISYAKVAVFLPRPSEGFYLPALEGMACETIVVCPDCIGNRGFCEDKINCFRPEYDINAIISATRNALQQTDVERERMLESARATVRNHSLEGERKSFIQILEQADKLWRG